jgi:hypothetical protein
MSLWPSVLPLKQVGLPDPEFLPLSEDEKGEARAAFSRLVIMSGLEAKAPPKRNRRYRVMKRLFGGSQFFYWWVDRQRN